MPKVPGIQIVPKVEGFRRAGIAHTGSKTYPLTDFSKEQLAALRAEPNLVCLDVEIEIPADKPEGEPAPAESGQIQSVPAEGGEKASTEAEPETQPKKGKGKD